MSKKASPATVGLFVLLGLALGVIGVVTFSSAKWFAATERYVLYFDASLHGLRPGAPVKFRGVTVGEVREVMIRYNQAPNDLHMPVLIELNQGIIRDKTDSEVDLSDDEDFQQAVQRGMRAKLESESFVTGVLYVSLAFNPDASPPVRHQREERYREIPTEPTEIEALLANLARVDLAGLAEKLNAILDRLDSGLGQFQVAEINGGMTNLLASLNRLAAAPELTNTLASANQAFEEVRRLSEQLGTKIDPLTEKLGGAADELHALSAAIRSKVDPVSDRADAALAEARLALQDLRDVLAPRSPLRHDLPLAIEQLGEAARSVAALADYLTRHPNALLSGKKRPDETP